LVADIERLRELFGLEKAFVSGGSWGSTLALAYALAHPERVRGLLMWSIYTATRAETEWVTAGGAKRLLPGEWERFIGLVPEGERADGEQVTKYYASKMRSKDADEAKRYAQEWVLWEASLLSILYDPQVVEAEVMNDPNMLAMAILETHYFLNDCFMPENYILDNIGKLADVPCQVVQGRFDLCTPGVAAYDLARAYGPKLSLTWVNSGHRRSDPEMLAALQERAARFLR
jgi:proline iminopeptidase